MNLYKLTYLTIIFILLSCSSLSGLRSVDKKTKDICEQHEFAMNIEQVRKKIIQIELELYKRNRLINKQHPIYNTHFVFREKDYDPIEQSYIFGKLMRQYSIDDPLIHFAEFFNSSDEIFIMSTLNIYHIKKIELLKTKVEIFKIENFVMKQKQKVFSTAFPMTIHYLDIDEMLRQSKRNYAGELSLIEIFEPNTYKKYYP